MKLKDKIALITGGGRGIGRAVAFAFAREGASIAVVARTAEEVARVAAGVRDECGVETMHAPCDVSDAGEVARVVASIKETFGRGADILVNNAGIAESAPFLKTGDEFWQRHLAINLSGTFYCTRAALPPMLERGWGRIMNRMIFETQR